MEKISQTNHEKEPKTENEGHKFVVFFLNEDEEQSVHVEEVDEVDFSMIIQHLNLGGSVFISHRRKPDNTAGSKGTRLNKGFENLRKPWHFAHI